MAMTFYPNPSQTAISIARPDSPLQHGFTRASVLPDLDRNGALVIAEAHTL
jgi:hypothetical protein